MGQTEEGIHPAPCVQAATLLRAWGALLRAAEALRRRGEHVPRLLLFDLVDFGPSI